MRKKSGGNRQKGIGLIEVLISILVISVGVLGLTGAQVTAKRAVQEAIQRSSAAFLAQDILERMRTNGGQLADYVTDGALLGGGTIGSLAKDCISAINICTPTELVAYDLYQWEQAIDGAGEVRNAQSVGGLLTPTACITQVDDVITVAIAWRGMSPLSNPTLSNCGEGLSRYGTDEEYRQVLALSTFISTK
jgi:type IV pilus assembly protein PilV